MVIRRKLLYNFKGIKHAKNKNYLFINNSQNATFGGSVCKLKQVSMT